MRWKNEAGCHKRRTNANMRSENDANCREEEDLGIRGYVRSETVWENLSHSACGCFSSEPVCFSFLLFLSSLSSQLYSATCFYSLSFPASSFILSPHPFPFRLASSHPCRCLCIGCFPLCFYAVSSNHPSSNSLKSHPSPLHFFPMD